MRNETCILRTGRLLDADLFCGALDERQIPYFRRQETSSGVEFAMPAAPSPGPGVWFTVWVPNEALAEARQVLQEMPYEGDRQPDVVDFPASPGHRRLIYVYALVILLLFAVAASQQCWSLASRVATG